MYCGQYVCGTSAMVATPHSNSISSAAGRMRRARRAQKVASEIVAERSSSRRSKAVIRKPEITKKTSTPTNPPEMLAGHR
jgi:hypothetical protein